MSTDETSLENVCVFFMFSFSQWTEFIDNDSCKDLHGNQHNGEERYIVEDKTPIPICWRRGGENWQKIWFWKNEKKFVVLTLSFIKNIAVVVIEESTYSSIVLECHNEGVEDAEISDELSMQTKKN